MKIALVAAGNMLDSKFYQLLLDQCDYIISIDGGSNRLYELGITPNLIIGDLDSISPKIREYYNEKDIIFKKFPTKKDNTDTELALDYALTLNPTEIILLGCIGSRMDHSLANINLLYNKSQPFLNLKIVDEKNEITIIDNDSIVNGCIGDIVSLIPIGGPVKGLTISGVEYALNNAKIEFGSTQCISNVMVKDEMKIVIESGKLLVIKSKD